MQLETGALWRPFGANSEFAPLRTVLLARPSETIRAVSDPEAALWDELFDYDRAIDEFDSIISTYQSLGVTVLTLPPSLTQTNNIHFMRDLFAMTPGGAIISRLAGRMREPEDKLIAQALPQLDVPLLGITSAPGTFEGPDLVFLSPNKAIIGIGLRTNRVGALQVAQKLQTLGIEGIFVETTYGCGHLDGVLSIIDRDLAVIRSKRTSYSVYELLKCESFDIIVFDDDNDADKNMAINIVAIEGRKVIMPKGSVRSLSQLTDKGVDVIEIAMPELMKGGGAIHCMTGIIERQLI